MNLVYLSYLMPNYSYYYTLRNKRTIILTGKNPGIENPGRIRNSREKSNLLFIFVSYVQGI